VDTVQLEDGYDVPLRTRPSKSPYRKAIREMRAGQSFVVPEDKVQSVRTMLAQEKKLRGDFEYTTRVQSDGRMRVWRTES
jgi:hypothetical protein